MISFKIINCSIKTDKCPGFFLRPFMTFKLLQIKHLFLTSPSVLSCNFNKNCTQKCVPHTIPFPETLCQIKNQIYRPFLEMHGENLLHQMTNTNDQM